MFCREQVKFGLCLKCCRPELSLLWLCKHQCSQSRLVILMNEIRPIENIFWTYFLMSSLFGNFESRILAFLYQKEIGLGSVAFFLLALYHLSSNMLDSVSLMLASFFFWFRISLLDTCGWNGVLTVFFPRRCCIYGECYCFSAIKNRKKGRVFTV